MASFPRIESPCPLRISALPTEGKDFCSMCERTVHNLSSMSQFERSVFMRSCTGKVCAAYSVPVANAKRLALASVGFGVAIVLGAGSAMAGDADAETPFDAARKPPSLVEPASSEPDCEELTEMIFVGGISSARDAEWVDANDTALAEIPTIAADALLDEASAKFGPHP